MFSNGILRALQNSRVQNSRAQDSRAYDWAMRLSAAFYSFAVLGHDVLAFYHEAELHPAAWAHVDAGVIVASLARIAQWMFVALLGLLPLIRHRPIARSETWLPRLSALLAVLLPPLAMLLPRAAPNLACNLIAVVLGLAASVLAVMTLSFLGRSFSVMPEARRLVTSGPYGVVRHPLYLFELLGVIGIVLQLRSVAGVALLVLIAVLQVARARFEEGVLARAIPDYAAYRGRVPFLLPRDPRCLFALLHDDPAARRRSGLVMSSALGLLAVVMVVLPRLTG